MSTSESRSRTAYWGTCDSCEASVVVYPHPDREDDVEDQNEWDGPSGCYVCDGNLDWGGSDPAGEIIRNYA